LSKEWDDLMRKTNSLSDRKLLAGLLNSHKNQTTGATEEL